MLLLFSFIAIYILSLFLKNEKHGVIAMTVYQQVQNRTQTIPLWALAYKKSSKQNLES